MALRVLVYDGTPGDGDQLLRASWATGAWLYRALRRVDHFHGATSWRGALAFLAACVPDEPIAELQFWGHGKWGRALVGGDALTAASFARGHEHREGLTRLRARLLPGGRSLVWFRTCETFSADVGHRFAATVTEGLGARAAGHTYVIGALQSGLHGLRPGASPQWSASEGLADGTAARPVAARPSTPRAPHTLHFMSNTVPEPWFDA